MLETSTNDTIVAIATPAGHGGIGIIRLSGAKALDIALKLARRNTPFTPRLAIFGACYSANPSDDVLLDSGLWIYFKAPHSFTGEDIVEFQGHGAPIVLDKLVAEAVACGARLATPGEFSLRAFLNQKIDLAQAEAIADLIHANSTSAARLAVRSLQGEFSTKVHEINQQLLMLRMQVEAAIDFSDEDIPLDSDDKITRAFQAIYDALCAMSEGASQGALLREGGVIVIAGPPNAGKSTLLNALSGADVAIVHDEAGTTRDVMKSHILIDDMPFELIDTAGLRKSDNHVEQEGIKRAHQAIQRADAVLVMQDVASPCEDMDKFLDDTLKDLLPEHAPLIRVMNKIDKTKQAAQINNNTIYLSAKTHDGLPLLKSAIKQAMGHQPTEGMFLARRRHLDALARAKQYLTIGQQQLFEFANGDLLAEDLKLAHDALSEITGQFTSDDLLGEIFSSFCIGK